MFDSRRWRRGNENTSQGRVAALGGTEGRQGAPRCGKAHQRRREGGREVDDDGKKIEGGKLMDLNANWGESSCGCFVFVDEVLLRSGSGSLHIREPRS